MKTHPPFVLLIGLDRSDAKADLHLIETASPCESKQSIPTSPEALQRWLVQLRSDYPQGQVAVCFEQPANNLIALLHQHEFITLFPVNPITLQKFREAFVTSRCKDDALDAKYLAQLLLHHYEQLTPWQPEDSQTRLLQRLVTDRRAVIHQRTALSNRLKAILKDYFPQALLLAGEELWRPMGLGFLKRWPSLQKVKRVKTETLLSFYHGHGSRSAALLQKRFHLLKDAVPLCEEEALLESYVLRVQLILQQLELVQKALAIYEKKIAAVFASHPDKDIFSSLPGAGPVLAPRLLAALGSRRERFADASAVQCYSGIAPVLKQSGNKRQVHRRYRCPVFVRQSFHEFAGQSVVHSAWAKAFYRQQRMKGAPHAAAVRALAYKWIRIIWRLWQDRKTYDEKRHLESLQKTNSPLAQHFFPKKNP